jgi:hypothetical protein
MFAKESHLGLIQAVANRIANDFFLLKGWTFTLEFAILALVANHIEQAYMLLAFSRSILDS